MDARTLDALDRAHLLHPLTAPVVHEARGPRTIVRAEGIWLETADGHRAIDGFSGLFNVNVGHGRREIVEAVRAQMERLAYYPSFFGFSSEPAIRLAARLAELFPADRELRRFLFTSGGSDANETAIRLARLYHAVRGEPKRQKIVSRRGAYHGITRAAGSATGIAAYHVFAEPDPLHAWAASPYCFRCELGKEPTTCGLACADDLEATLEREGPETVAAVIAEPVLGTGGIVPPPDGYFERLAEICARHGVLLILDEVITGFGRTGRWFGMERYGIHPDIVTFAKGITSGYLPLGGVALSETVYATLRDRMPRGLPLMVGLTYNNHPACCAAALANLEILEREGLVENAERVGAHLLARLRERLAGHPYVADVRGVGLLAAVECTLPGSREPVGGRSMAFTAHVTELAWQRGLVARALWDTIGLAPPLCLAEEEADRIVEILGEALDAALERFPPAEAAARAAPGAR